jgi:hypothetical protein
VSDPAPDALPAELDVTAYVGPYLFPTPRRRLVAAAILTTVAVFALAGYAASSNGGLLAGAILLLGAAGYHAITAWPLTIDQTEGLVLATRTVGFPVGHASAQLTWRGLRSRPTWRILLYSADAPPTMRGLVELDAVDGTILGEYTEANPEDWSIF